MTLKTLCRIALMICSTMTAAAQWDPPVGRSVVYKRVDGRELSLWVLEPNDVGAKDFRPGHRAAVVLIHGGGWTNGGPGVHNAQAELIAAHGAVAIQIAYRLLDAKKNESPRICVEDAKSAMRWVRAHAVELNLDAGKIAAEGSSAGGFDALYAGVVPGWDGEGDDLTVSARPDALVLLNPVLDISDKGYAHARFGDDAAKRSPEGYVSGAVPPMLVMSGSSDEVIHPDVLEAYATALKAAGARCELHIFPGQVHSFYKKEPYLGETNRLTVAFLASLGYVAP